MLLFVLLFVSLLTGFICSIIKIIKEHQFNVLTITPILNVILFVIIFIVS